MSKIAEKSSRLSRLGRWVAELVLVFVGVYAAFWLSNYQQHRQDAERRDGIQVAIEQTLREGVENGKRFEIYPEDLQATVKFANDLEHTHTELLKRIQAERQLHR